VNSTNRLRRIEEICDGALARPPGDRAAFVREACTQDDGIRHEVEAILANVSCAESFLEQPLLAVAANVLGPSTDGMLTGLRLNGLVVGPLIGAGGMGQVYRARDTRLHRDVAVKVLSPEFANDADRLGRLAREARVLASLNHPNIAQIHGLENTHDATAIVMELVEGQTLAERIARGALPVAEALPVARQIADALEAAHEQAVIHRDLKPTNIQVRVDGTVKVLDFGLAKSIHHGADQPDDSATLSALPGVVMGTAAYMAPEQATHKAVDRRVDMWAFGCVLFEMLSGRPVFSGETPSVVLREVVEREPDWDLLPAATPAAIRRLLQRCLEKDAKRRLDSAVAARLEIEEAAGEPAPVVPARRSRRVQRSIGRPLAWASGGALVALLATMIAASRTQPSEQGPLVVTPVLVERLVLGQPGIHFAVAPSGRTVVFAAGEDTMRLLFRRDLDRIDPEPIAGTAGGSDVFFSHDSRRLGFETASALWSTLLDGGTPSMLLNNQPLRGGTWGERDRIVVGRVGSGLWLTSAAGSEARQLTFPAEGERHELPQMLPGGRAVLFTILTSDGPARVAVHVLETGETRSLFEGEVARFVRSGHVVFGQQGKLWAVRFDPDTLHAHGAARPVRDDVLWSAAGYPQFAVDGDLLAYVRSSPASMGQGNGALVLANRQGQRRALPLPANNYLQPRWSPAGDRLVVQVGAARELWTYDLRRRTLTRLTPDRVVAFSAPAWTPDGSRVVFTTWFDGQVGLGSLAADGSGPVEKLVTGIGMRSYERTNPAFLPDGSGLILSGLAPGASAEDLLMVPLTGATHLESLLRAPGVERNPAIAPHGRLIAYNSDESGRPEVYVRLFPNVGARKWQISAQGGALPVWTRGGSEIVYRDNQGRIVAVKVRRDADGEFTFSDPEPLFTFGRGVGLGLDRSFDVTPDGERFLLCECDASGSGTAVELILIQNWGEELKRLVPREP
jgi:serine/threonine-protein kinase